MGLEERSVNDSERLDRLRADCDPLIRRLVDKYGHRVGDPEALRGQIGNEIEQLARDYDPACGVPFWPYLVRGATRRAYHLVRDERLH